MLRGVGRGVARALVTAAGLPKADSVRPTAAEAAAYEAAAARLTAADGAHVPADELPKPLMPFLCWLSEHRPVLYHGSARADIAELAPVRMSRDASVFGDQQAVYATADPIWASWFAVLNRDMGLRGMRNASMGLAPGTGESGAGTGTVFPRWYYFSVNRADNTPATFKPGTLYVLPSDGFSPEPRELGIIDTGQLVHTGVVRPVARITIDPADVPFVHCTVNHGKEGQLRTMLRFGRAHRRSRRSKRGAMATIALLLLALILAACGDSGTASDASTDEREREPATLHVFAASSLTEAFAAMEEAFEKTDDGKRVDVTIQFGASSTLAQQIESGAPADVFVSADEATMKRAVPDKESTVIARNRLAIVVEKGNPKSIDSLDDLAKPGVVLVLCAPAAPCGNLGAALLAKAGVDVKPASLEENVKAVVAKVTLGEADAGVVYETDVAAAKAAGTAEGVTIDAPEADDPALQAVYPMAVLHPSDAAKAWTSFVTSATGKRILTERGFLPSQPEP